MEIVYLQGTVEFLTNYLNVQNYIDHSLLAQSRIFWIDWDYWAWRIISYAILFVQSPIYLSIRQHPSTYIFALYSLSQFLTTLGPTLWQSLTQNTELRSILFQQSGFIKYSEFDRVWLLELEEGLPMSRLLVWGQVFWWLSDDDVIILRLRLHLSFVANTLTPSIRISSSYVQECSLLGWLGLIKQTRRKVLEVAINRAKVGKLKKYSHWLWSQLIFYLSTTEP